METKDEHKLKHVLLHNSLDELVADFIVCTGKLPSKVTVLELMQWSSEQVLSPNVDKISRFQGKRS